MRLSSNASLSYSRAYRGNFVVIVVAFVGIRPLCTTLHLWLISKSGSQTGFSFSQIVSKGRENAQQQKTVISIAAKNQSSENSKQAKTYETDKNICILINAFFLLFFPLPSLMRMNAKTKRIPNTQKKKHENETNEKKSNKNRNTHTHTHEQTKNPENSEI